MDGEMIEKNFSKFTGRIRNEGREKWLEILSWLYSIYTYLHALINDYNYIRWKKY